MTKKLNQVKREKKPMLQESLSGVGLSFLKDINKMV